MTALQIRPATAADAGDIARLLDQLGYPADQTEIPTRLDRLQNNGRAITLLAQRDSNVVGLVTAHVLSVLNRP